MLTFKVVQENEDYDKCLNIRRKVFIEEQNVSENIEIDMFEGMADHFLVLSNGDSVGTARLVRINEAAAKIGRVAVLKEYRSNGTGRFLMEKVVEFAKSGNIKTLLLASQTYTVNFYERSGFKAYGDEFLDADRPHCMMKLDIG